MVLCKVWKHVLNERISLLGRECERGSKDWLGGRGMRQEEKGGEGRREKGGGRRRGGRDGRERERGGRSLIVARIA